MSAKKERLSCRRCKAGFRSKNKKREYCDDCVRKMSSEKIIKRIGDIVVTHAEK